MISLNLKSISRSPLRCGLFLIGLAFALLALPGTVRGQMFVSVNSSSFLNGGSNVYQYDPTGSTGTPTIFLSNLDHPRGLAFDSAGNLYVATFTNVFDADDNIVGSKGAVLKVSGGVASTFASFTDGFAEGVVTDSAGNLFVSSQKFDDTESTIYKITPDGVVSTFGSVPGQCFGLAFDSLGNLFTAGASDSTNLFGTIYEFTPGGAPYEPTPTGTPGVFVGPEAFISGQGLLDLTFDPSGNLFASTFNRNDLTGEIRKFGPDGTEITPRFATGLTKEPRGLAFDSDGNLFLAEPGIGGTDPPRVGDILKFTPGGSFTYFDDGSTGDFGTRGNRGPEFLAFAPAPVTPISAAVVLTFPNTTETLITTTVEPVDQNSVPLPPSNFELQTGGPSLAYEISAPATATLPTPIIIGFTVPPSVWGLDGSGLKALHYDNGSWVDSTIKAGDPNYPSNPASYTVYASVNSLSPFLVAKFKFGAQVQQPINADGTSVFNAKRGVIPVAFTLTSDGASTCQLPPATISVFRTAGGVVGSIDESTYLLKSDSGSNFRIDSTKCQYVYNLGASSLGPGTYKAYISIGGSVAGSATFALK